jgi:small subunit ribosomal protein S7
MSRRRAVVKREIKPDPKYLDYVLAKFINCLMLKGKKSIAELIVYGALEDVSKKIKKGVVDVFYQILDNVSPLIEVRPRRVGGATYQVPVDVRPDRARALAIRWLINSSRLRSEKTMKDRLANEFLEAYQNRGFAVKRREDMHKMAEANKAFAHYRW